MSDVVGGYMPLDRQLFDRPLAVLVADLLAQKFRTTKELARGVGIDVSTAENLRKGHLSITTLQKVIAAEGRDLWERIGEELFGETFYQFDERRIQTAIKGAEGVLSNIVRLRTAREELLACAGDLDDVLVGRADGAGGRDEGRARSQDHDQGRRKAQGNGNSDPTKRAVEAKAFAPRDRGRT